MQSVRRSVIHDTSRASLHPLHLAQDLALVGRQEGAVIGHLLEHGAALELVTGLLEVVSANTAARESQHPKKVFFIQNEQDRRYVGASGGSRSLSAATSALSNAAFRFHDP